MLTTFASVRSVRRALIEVEKCRDQYIIKCSSSVVARPESPSLRFSSAARRADIAVVEPAQEHYYQPAFTLVGAGVYPLAQTRRPEQSLIPSGVDWIRSAARAFEPEKNTVHLKNGDAADLRSSRGLYRCQSGLEQGGRDSAETLGKNGVCSNYSPEFVTYTRDCLKACKPGSRAGVHAAAASLQVPRRAAEDRLPRRRRSSPPGEFSRIAAWTSTPMLRRYSAFRFLPASSSRSRRGTGSRSITSRTLWRSTAPPRRPLSRWSASKRRANA